MVLLAWRQACRSAFSGVDLGEDFREGWQGQETAHNTLIIAEEQEIQPSKDSYSNLKSHAPEAPIVPSTSAKHDGWLSTAIKSIKIGQC